VNLEDSLLLVKFLAEWRMPPYMGGSSILRTLYVRCLLSSQMNHSCSFIKQKFYWFFMPPGKDLEQGCSENLGATLGSCLAVGSLIPRTPPLWVFSLHIIMSKNCLKQKWESTDKMRTQKTLKEGTRERETHTHTHTNESVATLQCPLYSFLHLISFGFECSHCIASIQRARASIKLPKCLIYRKCAQSSILPPQTNKHYYYHILLSEEMHESKQGVWIIIAKYNK
jgi:hypothetical protein